MSLVLTGFDPGPVDPDDQSGLFGTEVAVDQGLSGTCIYVQFVGRVDVRCLAFVGMVACFSNLLVAGHGSSSTVGCCGSDPGAGSRG